MQHRLHDTTYGAMFFYLGANWMRPTWEVKWRARLLRCKWWLNLVLICLAMNAMRTILRRNFFFFIVYHINACGYIGMLQRLQRLLRSLTLADLRYVNFGINFTI